MDRRTKPIKRSRSSEKLHASQPQDASISRLLARLYARDSQYDKALALYTTLSAASPNDPTLLDDQADTLIPHMRRPHRRRSPLKRAVSRSAGIPQFTGLCHRGQLSAFASAQETTTILPRCCVRSNFVVKCPHHHRQRSFWRQRRTTSSTRSKEASDLYKQFLAAAGGSVPRRRVGSEARAGRSGIHEVT